MLTEGDTFLESLQAPLGLESLRRFYMTQIQALVRAALELDGRPLFPLDRFLTSKARRDTSLRRTIALALYQRGWTCAEIAEGLGLAKHTIQNMVHRTKGAPDDHPLYTHEVLRAAHPPGTAPGDTHAQP